MEDITNQDAKRYLELLKTVFESDESEEETQS